MATGLTICDHRPILLVQTGSECHEVQGRVMPSGNTQVRDVIGVSGTTVYGQGGKVPQAADKTDPLPKLWSRNSRGLNDGAYMADAWDGDLNRLEPTDG